MSFTGLKRLGLGSTRPEGWVRELMTGDYIEGFVGHLDCLVPSLFADDIYGRDRLTNAVKAKDVGATTGVDNENSAQFLWWNSETQSNWRDGWLAHALLVGGDEGLQAARGYVDGILATQDGDGYLGIYAPDLRFRFQGENGELWAQATLFRGLLTFYEFTADSRVLEAVVRATRVTMAAWPSPSARPFDQPGSFAGNAHGLMFIDVLDGLTDLTGDHEFRDYAVFLYDQYCASEVSEPDVQLSNLLDPDYRFQGHGVHTWEHLRALVVAATHSGRPELHRGLAAFLRRLEDCVAPSGGPIGDEWIRGRRADADETGYEYCSILELFDSYCLLLRKTGDLAWADRAEHLLFNAGLGARHPHESSIAYLKTDNSYSMTGVKHHDRTEADDDTQTRYRYSPVHQEAAVCCVPNAGRLFPSYLRSMILLDTRGPIVAFYGPNRTTVTIAGQQVRLEQITTYPSDLCVRLVVTPERPARFTIRLRAPSWTTELMVEAKDLTVSREGQVTALSKVWRAGDVVEMTLTAPVALTPWGRAQDTAFLRRGPLVYGLELEGDVVPTRQWPFGRFLELKVFPTQVPHGTFPADVETRVKPEADHLVVPLRDDKGREQLWQFVPMGQTVLRQVVFPWDHNPF